MDKALLLYGIQNIAEEYAGAGMTCYSCVYENSRIIWLLQSWEEEGAGEPDAWKAGYGHISGLLDTIQQTCRRLLRVSVSFAISSEPTALPSISERFHLLKYCFVYGLGLSPSVIVSDVDLLKMQEGGEGKNDYCHHARLQLLQRCLENNAPGRVQQAVSSSDVRLDRRCLCLWTQDGVVSLDGGDVSVDDGPE
ncbi:hypothetical protein VQ056_15880 [Paenibacillus sp. JTLBN-2024]